MVNSLSSKYAQTERLSILVSGENDFVFLQLGRNYITLHLFCLFIFQGLMTSSYLEHLNCLKIMQQGSAPKLPNYLTISLFSGIVWKTLKQWCLTQHQQILAIYLQHAFPFRKSWVDNYYDVLVDTTLEK